MEFNRNHYFMLGILLVMLGLQFRQVDSITLNDKVTRFLAEKLPTSNPVEKNMLAIYPSTAPLPKKVIYPPNWLGWSFISIGGVLVLHSLAMKKPGS